MHKRLRELSSLLVVLAVSILKNSRLKCRFRRYVAGGVILTGAVIWNNERWSMVLE